MQPKQYQINTVQDMIDCTNESNLENFLTDLKYCISSAHSIRNLAEVIGEVNGIPHEKRKVFADGFTWIDDGKHDGKITIDVKSEDS